MGKGIVVPSESNVVSIGRHHPHAGCGQQPCSVAVVMPTICRPELARALTSVFEQATSELIQILIGVDLPGAFLGDFESIFEQRPPNISITTLNLPYSTSTRHGGVHPAQDGGSLRSILSFMANARYVAYLDDDNSWYPEHLPKLLTAIPGKAWAFSRRMLVDEVTDNMIAVDRWDSVGVNAGRFAAQGGFVDPNCLLIDKVACAQALGRWSEPPLGGGGVTSDRNFFAAIRNAPFGEVTDATVLYRVRPTNVMLHFLTTGREF